MATKTLRTTKTVQPKVSTAVPVAAVGRPAPVVPTPPIAPTAFSTFFLLGETAYYAYNGVSLPVIVRSIQTGSGLQPDGSNVLYTVAGDVSGLSYPAGQAQGPFKNVPASALSTR